MEQSLQIDKKTMGKETKIDETIYKLTQEVNNKMEEYYQLKKEEEKALQRT